MRRVLTPLLVAALFGAPAVVGASEAACPTSVTSVRGSNPSYRTLNGYLNAAAAAHDVPVPVLKAIAFRESTWRQFRSDGRPVISTDNVCGIGLMQITLGSRTDGAKLASDAAYNAMEGAKILREKWQDGLNQTHPQPTGYPPDDEDVLENWYAAICRYNGCSFTANGDAVYAKPVALIVRSSFQAGVPSAIGQFMPPIGFTLPYDADPSYVFPGGFQARNAEASDFVFYDSGTGAVTKTVPARVHVPGMFSGYTPAYGPGGPNVDCTDCHAWRPAEGYGMAGWAHWTNSVAGAGTPGFKTTWKPPAPGSYDVKAYVPDYPGTLATVTYHVGTKTKAIDQNAYKNGWAPLGRATLSGSSPVWLGDGSTVSGRKLLADGVWFRAVAALSVTQGATAVTYGRSTTLTAKVSHVGGGALAGRQVTFEKRPVGVLSWTPVGTYATSSAGVATLTVTPGASSYYRATVLDDQRTTPPAPVTRRVDVRPRVSAALSRTSVPRGTGVKVSATITPAHGGQRVVLQRYASGGWHDALDATLSGTGTASWTFAKSVPGTYKYRVYKPADSDHVAGYGATLTLTVT